MSKVWSLEISWWPTMLWGGSLIRRDLYARSGMGYWLCIGECEVKKFGSLWYVVDFLEVPGMREKEEVRSLVYGLLYLTQEVHVAGMAKARGTTNRRIELRNNRLQLKLPKEVM